MNVETKVIYILTIYGIYIYKTNKYYLILVFKHILFSHGESWTMLGRFGATNLFNPQLYLLSWKPTIVIVKIVKVDLSF